MVFMENVHSDNIFRNQINGTKIYCLVSEQSNDEGTEDKRKPEIKTIYKLDQIRS